MGLNSAEYRSSEAVKTWMDGSERRFDSFTVAEYGMWDEAQTDERELENYLNPGVETALNPAERMAVAGGYLDPHRADGRVFFEDDAPPDPSPLNANERWSIMTRRNTTRPGIRHRRDCRQRRCAGWMY